MRNATTTAFTALLLTSALASCHSKADEPSVAPDPDAQVLVEVESHYQGDVIVYLVTGNTRDRLGTVTALSRAEFTFPYRRLQMSSNTRLLAYPLAGAQAYLSDPLLVQPGQYVSWTLESDLRRSSLAVY
jgi:hypothetical protein